MEFKKQGIGEIPFEVKLAIQNLKGRALSETEKASVQEVINAWAGENEFRLNYVAAELEPERGPSGARTTRPETPNIAGRNNRLRSGAGMKKVG